VARTGHFKWLIFGALVTMAVGLYLLSGLKADTPLPLLWAWMFVAGLGVGPTFAVFTLVVQNSVPVQRLGTATSNLTFFQQVGGTVGLAVTGTIFGTALTEQTPQRMAAAQIPPELAANMSQGGFDPTIAAGVGDLGASILAGIPEAFRAQVEPFIPAIVDAIYQAFSIATAATFQVGIIAAIAAAGLTLLLREAPAPAAAEEGVAFAPTGAELATVPVPVEIDEYEDPGRS
jgi:hypothetical protein